MPTTADDDLTAAVDVPTQAARELALAWSREAPITVPLRVSWWVAWRDAAAIAAAGLLIAIGVGGGWMVFTHHNSTASSPPTVASVVPAPPVVPVPDVPRPSKVADPAPPPAVTVTVAPPPAAPPPMSQGPSMAELDAQFLSLMTADGIVITDARAATAGARMVCSARAAGRTPASIAAEAMANNPALMTLANAQMLVVEAVRVYCPQYS